MNTFLKLALAILALTVAVTVGAVGFVAIDTMHHAEAMLDRYGDLATQARETVTAGTATAQQATQTMESISEAIKTLSAKGAFWHLIK